MEAIQYVKELCAGESGPALTSSEKLVLKALALFHKTEVSCAFAPVKRIAFEACVSESTVQRALKALQTKGLVLRHEARRDSNGSQTTNEYELPGMQSTAVGLEGRQQVFKVSRSRVAVQLMLPGKAPAPETRDEERQGTAVGLEGRQQVFATAVDISCVPAILTPPPVSSVDTPPGVTSWHPIEDVLEEMAEEKDPPLPLRERVEKEKSAKDFLTKEKAKATASATANATTEAGEAASAASGTGRVVCIVSAGRRMERSGERSRASLDGFDAALYDETTRVLVACGIAPDASTRRLRRAVQEALRMRVDQTRCAVADAGQVAVQRWREYRANADVLRFTVGFRRFIGQGDWLDPQAWPWDRREMARKRRM